MAKNIPAVLLSRILLAGTALPACAYASGEETMLEQSMPTAQNMALLEARMRANPNDYDLAFTYAQIARTQKKYSEAARALESMLRANPDLPRVKLDLAAIYTLMGRYDDARALFNEVLAQNPPPPVRENIGRALAVLEERAKKNIFTGSMTVGINYDTNANAAPSTGNITIVDTTIPLGAGAQSRNDYHAFTALNLGHSYRFDQTESGKEWRWNSSLLGYLTRQEDLHELNLMLYSLRTGPEVVMADGVTRYSLNAGYTYTELDKHAYLKDPKVDFYAETQLPLAMTVYYQPSYEFRSYLNSPTNTTFSDRTGRALQHVFGVRHPFSEKDLVDFSFLLRREQARQDYYANRQGGFMLAWLHAFSENTFASLNLGYRNYRYDLPDPLISATTRKDKEYASSLTLGHKISAPVVGELLLSASYQYRNTDSNIQNYEYDNHRVSVSVTKSF